jgi:hypothetical protein
MPCIPKPFHKPAGRESFAVISTDEEVWKMQADAAFKELKQMLSTAPVLASPMPKEPMLLYIAATNRVVSAVVVVERE